MQVHTAKLKKKGRITADGNCSAGRLHQIKRHSSCSCRAGSFTSSYETAGVHTPMTICAFVKSQV